jgi:hypothetical protein
MTTQHIYLQRTNAHLHFGSFQMVTLVQSSLFRKSFTGDVLSDMFAEIRKRPGLWALPDLFPGSTEQRLLARHQLLQDEFLSWVTHWPQSPLWRMSCALRAPGDGLFRFFFFSRSGD